MKPSLNKSKEQAQPPKMRGVAIISRVTRITKPLSLILEMTSQVLHILPLWTNVRLLQVSNKTITHGTCSLKVLFICKHRYSINLKPAINITLLSTILKKTPFLTWDPQLYTALPQQFCKCCPFSAPIHQLIFHYLAQENK